MLVMKMLSDTVSLKFSLHFYGLVFDYETRNMREAILLKNV